MANVTVYNMEGNEVGTCLLYTSIIKNMCQFLIKNEKLYKWGTT